MDTSSEKPNGLLGTLSADDLKAFLNCARVVIFDKDEVILRQGQTNASLFIVQDGVLHVSRQAKGRRVFLGRLDPGSFFGEISLFGHGLTTATVTGLSPGKLISIGREDLDRFAAMRPAAAAQLLVQVLEQMAVRLRDTDERLVDSIVWGGLRK